MADAAFVAVPYLVFLAPRAEWYGGWSPPFRYGLAFLPLLGIALTQSFVERRRLVARLSIGALGAATLVLALLWVSAPGWTYNFANGSSRVLDHLGSNLGVDVARVIPSYVRPRAASWGGPLAALLLALAWRLAPRRSTGGGGARWPRPRRATAAATAALGSALLLLSVSGVVIAAARVPTKTAEVEDAYVAKSGGELNPPMWTIGRWRYRGAWLLPEGTRIVVPVASGRRAGDDRARGALPAPAPSTAHAARRSRRSGDREPRLRRGQRLGHGRARARSTGRTAAR